MPTTFPWNPASEEIHRTAEHLRSSIGDSISPADLAGMINTAFWLSVHRHEDQPLRPVLRWCAAQAVEGTATRLANPVPLSETEAVRRVVAGWQAPRKLLIDSSDAEASIVGLAMEVGIWSGPSPSIVIEAVDPGRILVSSYSEPLVALRFGKIHLFDYPETSFVTVLQCATDLDKQKCHALHHLVRTVRNARCGGTFVLSPNPPSLNLGGHRAAQPWAVFPEWEATFGTYLRERVATSDVPPSDSAAIAQHFGAVRRQVVDALALLARTDGAVVLDRDLRLFSFGSRLPTGSSSAAYLEATVTALEQPSLKRSSTGGTRLSSAIDFIRANPSSFALVISHDGPVSIVTATSSAKVHVLRDAELLAPTLES